MAPMSRGKADKTFMVHKTGSKDKRTKSDQKHRFQGFSQRISNIKIKPLRLNANSRSHDSLEDDDCHFRIALDQWRDRAMSEVFVDFAREVDPISQSLPQLLHHGDRIVDLLLESLAKADKHSLEPLLDLIVQYAYDVGSRFEPSFDRTIHALSSIAANRVEIEAIEWSFNAIAKLLRYLSRSLVQDLTKAFALMSPLLGKQRQKPFVCRFTAEAFSFLLRKAAGTEQRSDTSLVSLVDFILADLASTEDSQQLQYQRSIMFMFSEAIRGVSSDVRSVAARILRPLLQAALRNHQGCLPGSFDPMSLLEGVLVSIIHNTNADGFSPVLHSLLDEIAINGDCEDEQVRQNVIIQGSHLLFVAVSVRKATRVSSGSHCRQNWSNIFNCISSYIELVKISDDSDATAAMAILKALAVVVQYSPASDLLRVKSLLAIFRKRFSDRDFLALCILANDLGKQRFADCASDELRRFIDDRCNDNLEQIVAFIPRLLDSTSVWRHLSKHPARRAKTESVFLKLADDFESGSACDPRSLSLANGILLLDEQSSSAKSEVIVQTVQRLVRIALKKVNSGPTDAACDFALSSGFKYLTTAPEHATKFKDLWPEAIQASKTYASSLGFLDAISSYADPSASFPSSSPSTLSTLTDNIIENLHSHSHECRLKSLNILLELSQQYEKPPPEALLLAQRIESSPFDLENLRNISMHVRNLGQISAKKSQVPWLTRALSDFCFGLLHVRLTPIWNDACDALAAISQLPDAQDYIMNRAVERLNATAEPSTEGTGQRPTTDTSSSVRLTDFECSNLSLVKEIYGSMLKSLDDAEGVLRSDLNSAISRIPATSTEDRSQALRVLKVLSSLTERKSRLVVPTFLEWFEKSELSESSEIILDSDDDTLLELPSSLPSTSRQATREDKKGILAVFAQFENPRVLFRSEEVFSSLLDTLCIGDVDLQRLSLKALFTWKLPYTSPYEDNLSHMLDDARIRDELAVFMNVDDETTIVQREHLTPLMPVLLRLLYGRMISREGMKNRGGRESRRKAVLLSLARFGRDALRQFIDIALHPLESLHLILVTSPPQIDEEKFKLHKLALRKQLGILNMIQEILELLSNLVQPFEHQIMDATLFCLIQSSRKLDKANLPRLAQSSASDESSGLHKAVRQQGLRCLVDLFNKCREADFSRYLPIIRAEVIQTRLANLPIESAQGVSVLLRLLSSFLSSPETLILVLDRGDAVSQSLAGCLVEESARDQVKLFVLQEILDKALSFLEESNHADSGIVPEITEAREALRSEGAQKFLTSISTMLAQRPSRDVVEAGVSVVLHLAPFLQQPASMDRLLEVCTSLLDLKTKNVSPRTRSQILTLLFTYLPKVQIETENNICRCLIDTLSQLFSYFLDFASRRMLCNIFEEIAGRVPSMGRTALICRKLNAVSGSRLDDPDLETRNEGFDMITDAEIEDLSAFEWKPVIHNLLYLLKDESEFSSTRFSATRGLCQYVEKAATSSNRSLSLLVEKDILPAVFRGVRERSEATRQEYLAVLAGIVNTGNAHVKDLQVLSGSNGQMSFFTSVLHIQQHQRLLALRQLATAAQDISSSSVSKVVLPLLETMLSQTDEKSQAVADEVIRTLEVIPQSLDWDRYKLFLQRTVQEKTRFESRKTIRALGAVVSALNHADTQRKTNPIHKSALARTLPDEEDVLNSLSKGVLDKLLEFVHFKDDTTVDLRVVVASAAVRLIMTFPEASIHSRLPAVLMDVTNVLRSKSQEARDAARKTTADIAAIIGPQFFSFLIRQLRGSLLRGTQLHVLSYTVHSLLLAISSRVSPGDLDSSVPDLMEVILGDCFGSVAQDKDAQGFRSKMKEVRKKALGYDSLEQLAALVSPESVSRILRPIQESIAKHRSESDKVDELLRRLREGLRQNKAMENSKTLMLCYELLRESVGVEEAQDTGADPSRFKIAAFSMDLLRRVIDKHEDLKTAHNLSAFVIHATKALDGREEESQVAAMRLLTSIIKIPIPSLDEYSGHYLSLTKRILEAEVSTATSLAQAALRLSAAVLRERPNAVMKKVNYTEHLAYTLTRLKPDLHEPAHSHERGRQVGAFNLLKAALGRGVLINEVYDIMDTVREVMITSPESEVRSSARAVYSRFVLDYYPTGGKAFDQQLSFLRKNMHCEIPQGRRSVMEVVDFVFKRCRNKPEIAQAIIQKFWDGLLDLLVADSDKQTSDMARLLLQKLFETADLDCVARIQPQLLQFTHEEMPDLIRRAGYRGWKLWFESREPSDSSPTRLMLRVQNDAENIPLALKRSKAVLIEDALECFGQLCIVLPRRAFSEETKKLWKSVFAAGLVSTQLPIKRASMQLVNMALIDIGKSSADSRVPDSPLCCSGGLVIEGDDIAVIIDSAIAVFGEPPDEVLTVPAAQSLRLVARVLQGESCEDAVALMLSQLSKVIRQEDTQPACKLAALKMVSSIAKDGPVDAIQKALPSALLTLSNLIDAETTNGQTQDDNDVSVSDTAREVLVGLKDLVGETEFLGKMQQVQSMIKERREERRAKRRIEAVSKPEVAGRKKAKKAAAKKVKRKEKNEKHAGRRRGF